MIDFKSQLSTKIRKEIVKALSDFEMIKSGDKVMVCVSGGKDSAVLLALLKEIQKKSPYKFSMEAVMLDQKQPGFNPEKFIHWIHEEIQVPFHKIERDTYSVVKENTPDGKTYCTLCSKFRRAILYDFAVEHGFTKIALGHHRDDANVTLLLNMFYIGSISSMPPKLKSDDGRNTVIRPLIYAQENEIQKLSEDWGIPILPCNLCSSQENLKRNEIKKLIKSLENKIPHISSSLITSMTHINPRHLMDKNLWNFTEI